MSLSSLDSEYPYLYSDQQQRFQTLSDECYPNYRVAVIGAGPAGLSAALRLTEMGHEVDTFDLQADVGGKVSTRIFGEDLPVNMSALWATKNYKVILRRAEELGIEFVPFPQPMVVLVDSTDEEALEKLQPKNWIRAIQAWVAEGVFGFEEKKQGKYLRMSLPEYLLKKYSFKDLVQASIYQLLLLKAFPQFNEPGFRDIPPEFDQSIGKFVQDCSLALDRANRETFSNLLSDDFVKACQIEPVAEGVRVLAVPSGYGYYLEKWAGYHQKALGYLLPTVPRLILSRGRETGLLYVGEPYQFHSLMDRMAHQIEENGGMIYLKSMVTKVERECDQEKGPCQLNISTIPIDSETDEDLGLEYPQSQQEREFDVYDFVVVATPLTSALKYLDSTEDEDKLFKAFGAERYLAHIFKAQGLPENEAMFIEKYTHPGTYEQTMAFGYAGKMSDGGLVYAGYEFAPWGKDTESVTQAIQENTTRLVADLGGDYQESLYTQDYAFFPHVSNPEVASDIMNALDHLQGISGIILCGESLGFSTMEGSFEQAEYMVETLLPDLNK